MRPPYQTHVLFFKLYHRTFNLNSSISRTATARGKAEQADIAALHARDDGKTAVGCAKEYAGDLVPVTPSITAAAAEGDKRGPMYRAGVAKLMHAAPCVFDCKCPT